MISENKYCVESLKQIKCFLLDMDGTIYLGDNVINGTHEFLDILKKQNKRAMYITNNSSKATSQYVEKLSRLGISSKEEDFFTSVNALEYNLTIKKPGARLFVLGTPAFEEYLTEKGFEIVKEYYKEEEKRPDFVILAFDLTLTYDKLRIACDYIADGVEYWSTHPDMVCPVADGRFIPDAGSFIECIYGTTGKRPSFIVGKPNPCMIQVIMEKYGYKPDEVAVIGDRLHTDIMSAVNAGVKSICVLSGETKIEDIEKIEEKNKPSYVFDSIEDVYDILKK
ncbi:MAG: HAD-IIA family hydrolase [Ruminococcaceae bacterium]|nr:HAD-IIA family hydrolase [Oscillospiraceae bacterium]